MCSYFWYITLGFIMEQVNFGFGLMNIPVPEKNVNLQMIIYSLENVIKLFRWKDFHFLNPKTYTDKKETF